MHDHMNLQLSVYANTEMIQMCQKKSKLEN